MENRYWMKKRSSSNRESYYVEAETAYFDNVKPGKTVYGFVYMDTKASTDCVTYYGVKNIQPNEI